MAVDRFNPAWAPMTIFLSPVRLPEFSAPSTVFCTPAVNEFNALYPTAVLFIASDHTSPASPVKDDKEPIPTPTFLLPTPLPSDVPKPTLELSPPLITPSDKSLIPPATPLLLTHSKVFVPLALAKIWPSEPDDVGKENAVVPKPIASK